MYLLYIYVSIYSLYLLTNIVQRQRDYCSLIRIECEEHSYSFGLDFVTVSRYSKCNLRLEIGLAIPQERPSKVA